MARIFLNYLHKMYQGNWLCKYNCTNIFHLCMKDIIFNSCTYCMERRKVDRTSGWCLESGRRRNQDMKLGKFYLSQDDNILCNYRHIYKRIHTEEHYTSHIDPNSSIESNKKGSSWYEPATRQYTSSP